MGVESNKPSRTSNPTGVGGISSAEALSTSGSMHTCCNLVVENISTKTTEMGLKKLFCEVAAVKNIDLKEGKAHVEYFYPKHALAAKRRFHKASVDGTNINVQFADKQ
tara:strand:+ start:148 stop:471 length:324 start_codon:yes stop_codon:yes gene_type:complete